VLSLFGNWIDLFRRDRLLADKPKFYRGLALGVAATMIVFLAVAFLTQSPWMAAIAAGLAGGALQPYLFRNLRYR
jgi:hypothetical protein